MVVLSFAFGWALVPLYGVFCRFTGIGSAEAASGRAVAVEAPDLNRVITIEFVADPATVGSFQFRPDVEAMQIHPGKLYDARFFAKNLSGGASVAQAVPSISPRSAVPYFHKTECFCAGIAGALHRRCAPAARHRQDHAFVFDLRRHAAIRIATLMILV